MQTSPRISSQIKRIKNRSVREVEGHLDRHRKQALAKFNPFTPEEAEKRWREWIGGQGWQAFPFQEEAWASYAKKECALISVPTGSGKTYAAFGGPLMDLMTSPRPELGRLRVIYISPMKALVRDVARSLARPVFEMALPFKVGVRTGDTSAREKLNLSRNFPEVLVTTPESLAILLTSSEARQSFSRISSVIVDEWHELLGNKRGSLLELTLASLKQYSPKLVVTAISATLGNLNEAAQTICVSDNPKIITDRLLRNISIQVITPKKMTGAPWFGYAGLSLAEQLADEIDIQKTQIIFTNTRAHAEAWYKKLLEIRPEWGDEVALHHGSLSLLQRQEVEENVKEGHVKVVVATSSLELGVDFPQVEKVFQIGSVKSLARAVQRAGRGFHRPGEASALYICPTNFFEILEVNALKRANDEKQFESRKPLHKPLDVFVQFLLNRSFAEGFTLEDVRNTLNATHSFKDISDDEIAWALDFLMHGGRSLRAYPQFFKIKKEGPRFSFTDARQARIHRMNIGTIVDDEGIRVKFAKGGHLGTISEGFVAKLSKGDVFQFAGKELEYVQLRDATVFVRLAKSKANVTTVWSGQVLPISPLISEHLRCSVGALAEVEAKTELIAPELKAFWPIVEKQKKLSYVPHESENLIERWKSREGYHLYFYFWAGRLVHEGLGHLFAYRIARHRANTLSVAVNDYGLELLGAEPFVENSELIEILSSMENLEEDIEASFNYPELSKRSFREVARVAGLIQTMNAGERKTMRHLQMSSSLLYEVFQSHDPENLLLHQARREVKSSQLQFERIKKEIAAFKERRSVFRELNTLSPFAFPLYIERIRSRLSTESLKQRIERMQRQILEGKK